MQECKDRSRARVHERSSVYLAINCWEVRPFFGKSVVSVMLSFLRTGLFSYQICKLETLNFLTL